jgi:4-amino-4-deoxy-L-arabinose transferase-like glycosyltransferase
MLFFISFYHAIIEKMTTKSKIILLFIIILAFLSRFYQIANVPPHLNRDEASMAYNAYSLLKTAKDEYGSFLPISIKSFGDYKLPVATYLLIPFIAVFGLDDWVIRLPAVLAGTATVFFIYLLAKTVFPGKKTSLLPIITAFLLVFNPYHFYFSRALYEVVIELLFLVIAVIYFIKALNQEKNLLYSTIFFSLSLFTYHGAHIFTPIFFSSLLYIYRKKVVKLPGFKWALVLFVLCFSLAFGENLVHGYKARAGDQTIFNSINLRYSLVERRRGEHQNQNSLQAKAFHNLWSAFPYFLSRNYLLSFSPDFLFFNGGVTPGQNLEDFGNFLLAEGFLIAVGLYYLIKQKHKYKKIIFVWIFITPLVSIFTTEVPHSPRNFTLVAPLILLAGLGLWNFMKLKNLLAKIVLIIVFIAYFHNLSMYLESYFYHLPLYRARYWDYGYKQLVKVSQQYPEANRIVVNNPKDFSYIYFLFYNNYPPSDFQKQAEYYDTDGKGLAGVKSFDKYYFRDIDKDNLEKNIFYVFKDQFIPADARSSGHINFPSGEIALTWFIL